MQAPTFKVYCGPMFSSKTSRLLMELERYKYQHKKYAAFKPAVDNRYSMSDIVTHSGWKQPATCVAVGADVLRFMSEAADGTRICAVDEAFMIPGIADVLLFLYQNGISVVVSTLDIAANGKPFPEVVKILAWATSVEKCTAVCTICGRDAHYTYKKLLGGDELTVEVGGEELYEPRCALCHPQIMNPDIMAEPKKKTP